MRSFRNVYGADFETDNDGSTAWICQWAVSDGTNEWVGKDLDSYMAKLSDIMGSHKKSYVYFHNLKYDLEFQKSVFHRMVQDYGLSMDIVMRAGNPIKIRFTKGEHVLEIRDSLKKMPGDLRSIGKMIGLEK